MRENNKCVFDLSVGFFNTETNQNIKTTQTWKPEQTIVLSELLYIAQAYINTTLKKTSLSNNSNEKEIIDCHNQPNRVLDSSYQPGGQVNDPAFQICKQAMDYAVNKTPPPNGPPNQSNNINPISSLAGNDTNRSAPLQIPAGSDDCYGDLDAEALENCITPDDDNLSVNNRPSLAETTPGFKPKGSGGSSGSGGGGLGGGGLGSLAGNDNYNGNGSMYPPYSGDQSSSPDFSDSDFASNSYSDGSSNDPAYRELAEKPEDDMDLGVDDMPFGEDEDLGGGKSIFQLASERIKTFCSDHSCDK